MSASKTNSTAQLGKESRVHDKLGKLKKRDYIVGDSADIVHIDWSKEWSELKNLDSESDCENHG